MHCCGLLHVNEGVRLQPEPHSLCGGHLYLCSRYNPAEFFVMSMLPHMFIHSLFS